MLETKAVIRVPQQGPGFKKYDFSELINLLTYEEGPELIIQSLSYSRTLMLQVAELLITDRLPVDLRSDLTNIMGGFADVMYDLENLEGILERLEASGVPMEKGEVAL